MSDPEAKSKVPDWWTKSLSLGLEKTRVFKKKPAQWYFLVFLGFLGFFEFFWGFLPTQEGF
jgi:hypothetical protein